LRVKLHGFMKLGPGLYHFMACFQLCSSKLSVLSALVGTACVDINAFNRQIPGGLYDMGQTPTCDGLREHI